MITNIFDEVVLTECQKAHVNIIKDSAINLYVDMEAIKKDIDDNYNIDPNHPNLEGDAQIKRALTDLESSVMFAIKAISLMSIYIKE